MTDELFNKLNQARVIHNQIKEIDLQIETLELMFLPSAIRYDKDKIQTSPQGDMMSDTIGKVFELQEEKAKLSSAFIKAMESVKELINNIDDAQARLVMKYRYICNIPWKEVAEKMNYSEEWCYKKHQEATHFLESLQ